MQILERARRVWSSLRVNKNGIQVALSSTFKLVFFLISKEAKAWRLIVATADGRMRAGFRNPLSLNFATDY